MADARPWVIPLPGGARLLITVDAGEVGRRAAARARAIRDIRPLLERIARLMREGFGEQFEQGGSPAWKALARSTVLAKGEAGLPPLTKTGRIPKRLMQRGGFGPGNILIASGALRDSYRQQGRKGHVERIDEKAGSVEVGSSLPYAAYHQAGTSPYVIMAKKGKALAFMGSGGAMVFRRVVQHPGLPARPLRITASMREQIRKAAAAHLAAQEQTAA